MVLKLVGVAPAAPESWKVPAWCTLPVFATQLSGGPADKPVQLDLSTKKGVIVGRSEERTDLSVPDASVSRQHAAIVHDEETTYIVDLGSTHGTFVEAARLEPNKYTKLSNGDTIAFGTAPYEYKVDINTAQRLDGSNPPSKKARKSH
uniref:FHA domain-containing protein n=2 Tax=Chrysotila carterae TaxID=13221 RepID=A0A7S4B5J5_CHRCT